MKKLFLKSLALVMMLMMSVSMWAESYCHTLISNGSKSIYMTCSPTDNANEYQILFEGTDDVKLTGTNLVNVGMNDINGQPGGNALSFVTDATGNGSVKATFTSATTPGVPYVAALFFATSVGEVAFNPFPTDMDWAVCEGAPTPGPEPEPEPEPTEIDWSTISWVGASGDKFKVGAANDANLPGVGTVQKPGWAAKNGIYLTFPAAGITCSHNCAVDGAGICLYIDQFVAKETEVTVNYAGGSKTFVVYYADGLDDPDAEIPSEYCSKPHETGNWACLLTWETLSNGNVVITLTEPDGSVDAEKTHFRNNGVNIVRLTVGGEDATTYFNSRVNATSNVQTLELKDPAVKPARGAKFAYPSSYVEYAVVKDNNCYPNFAFSYTYGGICAQVDAPTNVAVATDGTITFDAVDGAEKYEAHVFVGADEVYSGEVTNGGKIDYQVYVAKTLTVKLLAKIGNSKSDFSDAATWTPEVSSLPASAWCEKAGVATAKNNYGDAHFSINTLADGNVSIVITSPNGTAARYRNAKGMNGTFKLNGTTAEFDTYFTGSKTSDDTFTLALKDPANKPVIGSVIDYSGQIECATSQNIDDYSNYDIKGYIYGTKCPTDVPVSGVALSQTTATIYVGDAALSLSPVFTPSNAGNKNVTWATSADAVATVVDGQVTAVAPGEATITVTTEDGGYEATCVVTVRAAIEAPTAPTWDAAVVKAVYSATYGADCGFGEWGGHAVYSQQTAGKKYVGGNYFGLLFEGVNAKNCAAMDHLHLDVYPLENVNLEIFPIWGGTEQGIRTGELTAGQWNSVDMELSAWTVINNWTNIYQIKVAAVEGKTIYLNNVYFYREAELSDDEAPVMTSASFVSASFLNAVLAVEATDNVGVTQYLVKNGDAEVGKFAPADGKITVNGLAMGTEYTLSVYALDAADNVSANKKDVNFSTVAGPTPVAAPTYDAADVIALYSDAYSTVAYNVGGWGQTTHQEDMEIAVGEHALLMTSCNYQGWEFATQDLSGMTHVHFDVYVAEATTIQFTPIWGGEAVNTFNLVAGWNSIEAPLTLTWPAINLANVYQVKFAIMPATCWIDNVFFVHKVVAVESISLDKTELTLAPEASETLVATVLPVDATNKNFTWATDAAGVATVVDGVVTAVAEGTANITATTEDGSKVATCVVTVAVVHPTGVELNKTALTLNPEGTETLVATVAPADAANKNVTWATDNAEVATVVDGVVTAVAEGTANITVTTEDGSKTATCVVTVENPDVVGPDEVMLQSGAHKIFYTAYKYACGVYELTIRSNETLNGFGGSFFNPGNVDVRTKAQKVGDKLVLTITDAASAPQFYTPLYMMMPGEVNFGSVTIDWIAKNPVATASSGNGIQAPLTAGHGNRWASAETDTEWWMINYNHKHEFNTIAIDWEAAYAKQFTLEGSNDGENFTVLYTEENQTSGGEHIYTLDATVEYQYVKVNITKRATGWGNSFWEFKTYTAQTSVLTTLTMTAAKPYTALGQNVALTVAGKDQYNAPMAEFGEVEYTVTPAAAGSVVNGEFVPAQKGNATISAHVGEVVANEIVVYVITENVDLLKSNSIAESKIINQSGADTEGAHNAFYAIDGNDGSTWDNPEPAGTVDHVYDVYFVADLGDKFDLEVAQARFEGASPANYQLDASLDGIAWTTIATGTTPGMQTPTIRVHDMSAATAVRYVRFKSTKAATGYGIRVYSINIFGQRNTADDVHVTAVSLNKTETSIVEGGQETLVATVTPDDATNKAIIWTSSAEAVATVADGVVTAVAPGEATITAKSSDNAEALATCVVTVTADLSKPQEAAPAVATDGVEIRAIYTDAVEVAIAHDFGFNPWGGAPVSKQVVAANNYLLIDAATADNMTMGLNNDGDNAIIAKDGMSDPENAEHKGLYVAGMKFCHIDIWSQVAKNNVKVLINDHALTSINLTDEGWQSFDIELVDADLSAAANVRWMKVIDLPTGTKLAIDNLYFWKGNAAVASVSLNKTTTTIFTGKNETLVATVAPDAAANKNVTWTSDNAEVATVDENGKVTAVAEGTANITATSVADGTKSATCVVTVTVDPDASDWVVLENGANSVRYLAVHYIGSNVYSLTVEGITADVTGMGGAYWNLSSGGARIDAGKEQISAAAIRMQVESTSAPQMYTPFYVMMPGEVNFGQFTINWLDKEAPVTPATGVELDKASHEMAVGENYTLLATVLPALATNKNVTWTSSDETIATVENGVVSAIAAGSTTITVTTVDGNFSATCAVTVLAAIEPVTTWASAKDMEKDIAITYSITRNANRTLTYAIKAVHEKEGFVLQVNDGEYRNTSKEGDTYTYTSTATYADGAVVNGFFHMPYAGGAGRVDFHYTVGSEREGTLPTPVNFKQETESGVFESVDGEVVSLYVDRTIADNGFWNTLCLPFDMTAEQIEATFGAGAEIRTLAEARMKSETEMYIRYDLVSSIEAGHPYIIKTVGGLPSLFFEGVTVDANATTEATQGGVLKMIGTFYKSTIPAGRNYLYLDAADGYLHCYGAELPINAFRCYFQFIGEAAVAAEAGVAIRARISMGTEVTTDIENLNGETEPMKVLINGQVFILRGAKMYNAQGQLVK